MASYGAMPISTTSRTLLMAAFQGGMLLTQAARDHTPLRNALHAAIAYVESHAPRRAPAGVQHKA